MRITIAADRLPSYRDDGLAICEALLERSVGERPVLVVATLSTEALDQDPVLAERIAAMEARGAISWARDYWNAITPAEKGPPGRQTTLRHAGATRASICALCFREASNASVTSLVGLGRMFVRVCGSGCLG